MEFPALHQFLLQHGYVGSSPWMTPTRPTLAFFEIADTLNSDCRRCRAATMRPLAYAAYEGTPVAFEGATSLYSNTLAIRHCATCDDAYIQDSWEMPLDVEVALTALVAGQDYNPHCHRLSAQDRPAIKPRQHLRYISAEID